MPPATPEPQPASAPRSRWRTLRRGLLVAVLAVIGYAGWRTYSFRTAIKEANAYGWNWTYDDPIDAIRKDWKAFFDGETWTVRKRDLILDSIEQFEQHYTLVRRLDPWYLGFKKAPQFKKVPP